MDKKTNSTTKKSVSSLEHTHTHICLHDVCLRSVLLHSEGEAVRPRRAATLSWKFPSGKQAHAWRASCNIIDQFSRILYVYVHHMAPSKWPISWNNMPTLMQGHVPLCKWKATWKGQLSLTAITKRLLGEWVSMREYTASVTHGVLPKRVALPASASTLQQHIRILKMPGTPTLQDIWQLILPFPAWWTQQNPKNLPEQIT